VACLMVTVAVTTSRVVLWRFAEGQKSTLRLLTGVYKDGLSAPDLVRGDARAVSDALDRAQGDRHAGVEPRYTILELPNGILNYILGFIFKLTTYEYIALEIVFCLVDFGTIALLIVLGRHMKRRRLLKYLDPLHTKERDDIAPLLLDPRHRTTGRISLLAQWIVVGLLLVAIFNLFRISSNWEPQSTLAFSDFLNVVNSGRVSDVTIKGNNISGHLKDGPAFTTYAPNNSSLVSRLIEKNVRITAVPVD